MNTSQSHTCARHQPQRKALRTRWAAALYICALFWLSLGCFGGGGELGWDASPGQDAFLDDAPDWRDDHSDSERGHTFEQCDWTSAIAVDPVTDTVFVQQTVGKAPCERPHHFYTARRTLFAVAAGSPTATVVLDTSDMTRLRLAFAKDHILLIGNVRGVDQLTYLDRHGLEVVAQHTLTGRFGVPQTSPSGRYVMLKPNSSIEAGHLIDTQSMTDTPIVVQKAIIEAAWSPAEDRLIVMHSAASGDEGVEVHSWDMGEGDGERQGLPDFSRQPSVRVKLREPWNGIILPPTQMHVRPDGQEVAFHLRDDRHKPLLVRINPDTGHFQTHADVAQTALRYSGDSAHLVTHSRDGQMMIINTRTDSVRLSMLDSSDNHSLYITADGTRALSTSGDGKVLHITELDSGRVETIAQTHNGALKQLVEVEARSEIWLVGGAMGVLHPEDAKLESFTMGWRPEHINHLPGQDLMVLDDRQKNRLLFLDPTTKAIVREVTLPLDGIQRYPLGSEADIERTTDARPQTFTKPETRPRRF